jgi:Na+-transporting NADH:ubiquinone oxidoreductase subunit B
MKLLRRILDRLHPPFDEGGRLRRLYPFYEAADTYLYTPGEVTRAAPHVRDGLDLKRMMVTVGIALWPCVFMTLWNTGYQANRAIAEMGLSPLAGWRSDVMTMLGIGFDPQSLLSNVAHGALYYVPIFLVCNAVGGTWELLFAIVRRHEVSEGFLVTGVLFPLILPPTIPLWQVALGISFATVLAKEVFGGTGRNFLNPAVTARAFLFFAYPAQFSVDRVWVAVDGYSRATPLTALAASEIGMDAITAPVEAGGLGISWWDAFIGVIPGSIGETSALACLLGAALLLLTGIGSWRIMVSMLAGMMALTTLFWWIGSDTNPMFAMNPLWHLVVGGFAFGLVFMATDPVSATMTETGMWYYGALIGTMTALIRVVNPAFPEGVLLAILFANVVAPLIDYVVVEANVRRRRVRHAT